jgi:hypothetical protein
VWKQVVRLEDKAALRAVLTQLVLCDGFGEVDLDTVLTADLDDPGVGHIECIECTQQCRLARTGRSDDGGGRATRNGERNTLQHFVVSEGLVYALGDDPVL